MDRSYVVVFFPIDKNIIKFFSCAEFICEGLPIYEQWCGEKITFFFLESNAIPNSFTVSFYFLQNISYNEFIYWLLIDLQFCFCTFCKFYISWFLLAILFFVSFFVLFVLFVMNVFIPLVVHGFSSSFLTFLIPCFMGTCFSRVLLNKWKYVLKPKSKSSFLVARHQ